MRTRQPSLDRISTLPDSITETILTLMPIRDALRTSILSKRWRYSWRSMPTLAFKEDMVKSPSHPRSSQLKKYKLVSAIFHVLLFHNGPTIVKVDFSIVKLQMVSELDQIISYLSRRTSVKELNVIIRDDYYSLPVSFFSLQGLESICLTNCNLEPPLTFNGFSRLREVVFFSFEVSAKSLQGFLSKCPLLDGVTLGEYEEDTDITTRGNKFTFGHLFWCDSYKDSFKTLEYSSNYYPKCLGAGGIPHKYPTSSTYVKRLCMDVCLMEHDEISSILCMIKSSPLLELLILKMHDNEEIIQQTSTKFLDSEGNSDWKLDRLEMIEIIRFSCSPLETEFVKLILAKSPVLKEVKVLVKKNVSDGDPKKLGDWLQLPFQLASPVAKLFLFSEEAIASESFDISYKREHF